MDSQTNFSDSSTTFQIDEATIEEIQLAFKRNELTSKELVQHYLNAIKKWQDKLHAVIEVNPDALAQAEKADNDRKLPGGCFCGGMQGIPVLLKDNISTKDKLNTTSGSFALLGSIVPRDAGVIDRLRMAGAIILGKAGLSEWANFRGEKVPDGWSARGGTVQNPYVLQPKAGGSSTGSAVSVAANLVSVSLGTETAGSIMNPCSVNCVVGIKPTMGLTSRSGVIPITLRQDSVGPIGRTVSDAVYLLDTIVGYDPRDEATKEAHKYIPRGGYKQFLKVDGLRGKRIGNMWDLYKDVYEDQPSSPVPDAFRRHIHTMSQNGAIILNAQMPDFNTAQREAFKNMLLASVHEFKRDLNIYLSNLLESPIRSLADAIAFNEAHPEKEKLNEYDQNLFIKSQETNLPSSEYTEAISKMEDSKQVIERILTNSNFDCLVVPEAYFVEFLGIGGCPAINVPAGFDDKMPFGILFCGRKGSEPKLIEIAYSFEQATKVRRPPTLEV